MKVTDIRQQVKNQSRYSIYVDGKYSFSLSELGLINSGLHTGMEVTGAQLEDLKDNSRRDKAYNQALGLLARRARSEWELRDYLKRKEYEPELADEIISKLKKLGYVNDREFARAWVENRRLLKATSKRRLSQELKQKRVSDDVIQDVLAADETDERQVLRDLVGRKRKQLKYQDDLKLMQYLMRQGYNYDDVKSVLSDRD